MKLTEESIHEALQSVSPRTQARIKKELARGDYHRISGIIERKILFTEGIHSKRAFEESNQAHSFRTEQRKNADIRHGRTLAERPDFVAWDGEGREFLGKHRYTLLANSRGEYIENLDGLGTKELLNFLVQRTRRRTVNIFYSFGYDIQQIVADIPDERLIPLMKGEKIWWEGYYLQYFSGKIFTINNYVRFYDIFSFFHKSFVKAVSGILGPEFVTPELVSGKEARSDFNEWTPAKIRKYNKAELILLKQVGEKLRNIFDAADINLRNSYYGPGAIARYWFRRHRIKPIPITDPELLNIFERGYYGGRFETFDLGKQAPVFEYDLHSAYPSAIRELQYLDNWIIAKPSDYSISSPFSIWHVEWHLPRTTKIGPFPSRDKNGLISYPANGLGWYYKPEVDAALNLYHKGITILEGRNPEYVGDSNPFNWVEKIYDQRAELKQKGNPAEWALKVGLNSLYGKTAQRIGTNTFFCLPWAGWITSSTRAKLLSAVNRRSDSIIAFATDAVYSTEKLPSIRVGEKLGEWEFKEWNEGYFIQSGVYRLVGESSKDAYRGFHSSNGLDPIFEQLRKEPLRNPSITQTRFVTHLEAIKFPNAMGPHRLKFIKIRKELAPYRPTKRIIAHPESLYRTLIVDPYEIDKVGQPVWIQEKVTPDLWVAVFPLYHELLTGTVKTRILENMNDHRDPFYTHTNKLGPFEESYPFRKLLNGQDKELNGEPDQIAIERMGERGTTPKANIPVIDEATILTEYKA